MANEALARRAELCIASALAALAFALYLRTLCHGVYWYDSAEYVTAAVTLGVPHPPGYPLYTLSAHLFTWLPLPPALAVNAMSACFGAVGVALTYLCSRALGASRLSGSAAALLLASAPSFWLNATIAEVYTPGVCVVLGILLLLLRARANRDPRLGLGAAALAGAGLGIHYSVATLGVGFAWLALEPAWGEREGRARRLAARGLSHAALALFAYAVAFAYVFVRAGDDVVPNQAYPPSAARFAWLLSGGNYRLWFRHDQTLDHAVAAARLFADQTSLIGLVLAAVGLLSLGFRDRGAAIALFSCIAGNLLFFFRYRVADLEVFLLPSVALGCVLAGVGIETAARAASAQVGIRRLRLGILLPLGLGILGGARMLQGFAPHDLNQFSEAFDYGARVATQLPANAVILNYTTPEEWKRHAVFGMYFQNVLGRRTDVRVIDNVDRPILDRLLREDRPTFLYAPVAHVVREYVAVPDGDLYRLVRRR